MQKSNRLQQEIDAMNETITVRDIQVTIRPFRFDDSDYQAIVTIANAITPETPLSVKGWRHWDRHWDSKYDFERFIVEQEGQIVATGAYGHTFWSYQPDKYFIDLRVHPDSEGQGITNALYDYLIDALAPRQPRKMVSSTREHQEKRIRFLEKRGYRQVMRTPVSRLDPATFNATRFADKVERVLDSGIVIKTMRQLSETDPDWKRKLYELDWECFRDVPSLDPPTKWSFEQFEEARLNSPSLLPDAYFVAVDGDQYVGESALWRNLASDRLLETGLTGVVRSHRRRGIATALKVHGIQYAQAHRNPTIETDNEENNPMYQLNLQLGFVPQPAHLLFEKRLDNEMRPLS